MSTTFDDYGNSLELSNSPGLAPLSGDAPSPSIGLAGDATAGAGTSADSAAATSPALDTPAASQAATSGLGMADYKSARSSDDEEYLKSLPTAQKIGLMLQSFSSGVSGTPNPIDALLENKRKREVEFRNELQANIKLTQAAITMVAQTPAGPAREALKEQIVRAGGNGLGAPSRQLLDAVGVGNDDKIKQAVSVLDSPAAQQLLISALRDSKDPVKDAQALMKDKDFMDRLYQRADQSTLPGLTAKLAVLSRAIEKMPQFQGPDGKASFTMADLRDQNTKLPKEMQLTDAELATANRNQAALITYGLKTDKTQQDEQSADARRKEEGPHTEIAKLNDDLNKGRITRPQYLDAVRRLNLSVEKQNAATGSSNVVPSQNADLHGKDYLDTLPSGTASTVRGIAEGRIDPKTLSTRGGAREAMLERVTQYDPNFNQANYGARAGVQKDFTSGKTANNVTAINTAIGHLGTAYDLQQALTSNDTRLINQAVNKIKTETGDQSVNNYDTAISAVGNELMRVFRQVGASEVETRQWEEKFKAANSPEQRAGALRTAGDLLQSRIDAVNDQWKRGMNTQEGFPNLLSEKAGATMAKIRGGASASTAPPPGTVKGGYRFKGGDPSKQENWEKV